jgi:glycosyltransferase involved in cell wall biosynthesis
VSVVAGDREYDVVMALTYYAPYVSGLTEAARVVAEGLAAEGQRVLVVATRHDRSLPRREMINGVEVRRTAVVARLGKGVVSPAFPFAVARAARRAAVLNLHLPLLEAGPITLLTRRTPVVLTYQCDVAMSGNLVDRVQQAVMDRSVAMAMRRSRVVAPSSDDYAQHSRLADAMADRSHAIAPPCLDRSGGRPSFREGRGLHVGFVGRIVEEKGLEYLIDGFRQLDDPDARLLVAGDYSKIAGGSVVDAVRRAAGEDSRVRLLGFLPEESLPDLYASLDVFALPSVNSFEAFGIVQVEAMMTGVPSVASDLPGVRIPVRRTGFGKIVPPRDAKAIHRALEELRASPLDQQAGAAAARHWYGPGTSIREYRELFASVRT